MFITDKICFVHLPRTGGSFVRHCLSSLTDGHEYGCGAHNYPCKKLSQYTFGFIRNPFDWYVSWWAHMGKQETLKKKIYRDCYHRDFNIFIQIFLNKRDLKLSLMRGWLRGINFSELYDRDIGVLTYLFEEMFKFNDRICFFENIREGLKEVLTDFYGDIDYNIILTQEPIKKSRRFTWGNYYTQESIELVRRKDKKIFDFYEEMGNII